jgi:hypothetical protein
VTTTCSDGTTTTSSGKGTCSGHGGIQQAAKAKPATAATAAPAAAAPAAAPAAAIGSRPTYLCRSGLSVGQTFSSNTG